MPPKYAPKNVQARNLDDEDDAEAVCQSCYTDDGNGVIQCGEGVHGCKMAYHPHCLVPKIDDVISPWFCYKCLQTMQKKQLTPLETSAFKWATHADEDITVARHTGKASAANKARGPVRPPASLNRRGRPITSAASPSLAVAQAPPPEDGENAGAPPRGRGRPKTVVASPAAAGGDSVGGKRGREAAAATAHRQALMAERVNSPAAAGGSDSPIIMPSGGKAAKKAKAAAAASPASKGKAAKARTAEPEHPFGMTMSLLGSGLDPGEAPVMAALTLAAARAAKPKGRPTKKAKAAPAPKEDSEPETQDGDDDDPVGAWAAAGGVATKAASAGRGRGTPSAPGPACIILGPKCTGRHPGAALVPHPHEHGALRSVGVCRPCAEWYKDSGTPFKVVDGAYNFCRCCGGAGATAAGVKTCCCEATVAGGSYCPEAFCTVCIGKLESPAEAKKAPKAKKWLCYKCRSTPWGADAKA